jgi:type IV pilus assembly protein PilN
MIKINLVAESPTPAAAKKKVPEISLGARQGDTILVIVLVIGVAVSGGQWYLLSSHFKELKRIESERRRERDELQQYIDRVDELEAKREALRRKIQVINDLKQNQQGPVRIMDEVSRALPELVWLTNMTLTGNNLQLSGMAMDENAVANYIGNLSASPFFNEPTLGDLRRGAKGGSTTFSFRLTCVFTPSPPRISGQGG